MSTRRLTRDAILTGVALIIFSLELMLPGLTPVPGIKLGLSNIITLFALFAISAKDAALILALRILLGALICGNVSALLYSACGGAVSFLVMLLLSKILSDRQIWVAGVLGALFHNIAQLAAAMLIAQTPSLIVYLPVLALGGIVAGLFTGLCVQFCLAHMRKPRR